MNPPDAAALLVDGCPDCNSDQELVEPIPGVVVVSTAHDDTCPWWRAHQEATRR